MKKGFIYIIVVIIILSILIIQTKNEKIGGERDSHGCLGPAGYTWNEDIGACVREWEVKNCEVDSDCMIFGENGDCNCGCYNQDNLPSGTGGECFCAAPTSCKCIDGICEGVFE